jgi:hypothetical protein
VSCLVQRSPRRQRTLGYIEPFFGTLFNNRAESFIACHIKKLSMDVFKNARIDSILRAPMKEQQKELQVLQHQ